MADNVEETTDRERTRSVPGGGECGDEDPEVQYRQAKRKVTMKATHTQSIPEEEMQYLRDKMKQARPAKRKDTYDEGNKQAKKKYDEDDIKFSWLQLATLAVLSLMLFYVLYEREHVHICALRFYGYVAGDVDCQHMLGQRYYLGQGVTRNKTTAFYWFKLAAAQGHPEASYNLAVAHIQGFWRLERKGEAHDLIKHAASHGIREAEHILNTACAKGECDR